MITLFFYYKNSHLVSFEGNTILYTNYNIVISVLPYKNLQCSNTLVAHVFGTSRTQNILYKLTIGVYVAPFPIIGEGNVLLMVCPSVKKFSYVNVSRAEIYWPRHSCRNQGQHYTFDFVFNIKIFYKFYLNLHHIGLKMLLCSTRYDLILML